MSYPLTVNLSSSALFLAIALLLLVVLFSIYNKRKQSDSYKMAVILKSYSKDEIKDFIIPDGIGGLLEIEHLILLDQGLLLIKTYPMSGNLFGADEIDQWSQIVAGKSFKFANPLRHIRTSRQALKALAPNIPIFCRIVFTADSVFPKGKPEEVSVLNTLADDLKVIKEAPLIAEKSKHSWDRIMRIARKNGQGIRE